MFLINNKCGDADSEARLRQLIPSHRHICFITIKKRFTELTAEMANLSRTKGKMGTWRQTLTQHRTLHEIQSINSQVALRKAYIISLVY